MIEFDICYVKVVFDGDLFLYNISDVKVVLC